MLWLLRISLPLVLLLGLLRSLWGTCVGSGVAIRSACEGKDEHERKSDVGEEGSGGTRGSGSDGVGKDGDDGGGVDKGDNHNHSVDKGGKGSDDGKGGNGGVDKDSGDGGKGSKVKKKDLRRMNNGICCVVGMERELGGEGDAITITDVI